MTKLKDIAEIRSGIFLNSSPTGTISYLQMKHIMMDSPEKISAMVEYKPRMESNMLRRGDLLFAGKGTTYLCKIFNLDIKAVASTTLYTIRLHSDSISSEYLCWYLNLPNIVNEIKASQIGSSTPLIHKSTLENIEIPIPDHNTQKKVVEISELQKQEAHLLDAIAEKRTNIINQLLINEINK